MELRRPKYVGPAVPAAPNPLGRHSRPYEDRLVSQAEIALTGRPGSPRRVTTRRGGGRWHRIGAEVGEEVAELVVAERVEDPLGHQRGIGAADRLDLGASERGADPLGV